MATSQLQKALAEAYASAPQQTIILDTLEINNRAFDTPIRIVRWPVTGPTPDYFNLKLEATAPHNPNSTVKFVGFPFDIVPPENGMEEAIGSFQVRIDNIGDYLDQAMEWAAIDGSIITGIYRTYVKGMENQGPSSVWSGLEFEEPRFEGLTFVINAAVIRWAQRAYGFLYTALDYPALVTGR